ncbi:SsgA family sporulation/cell division regulator [Kitasatospora sp. NPDC059571]|uniref:SsgA family sporulation/cell division regulator n=1 Tax=Kitasatospora sp. NPDC059571 TaxID=3346871 RepID=UPI00369DBAD4
MSWLSFLRRRLRRARPRVTSRSGAAALLTEAQRLPASVVFRYDAKNPFAVRMTVSVAGIQVEWVFDRDLLVQGVDMPTGLGAVQVWPSSRRSELAGAGDDIVLIRIAGTGAQATLAVPAEVVRDFVKRAEALVPAGSESERLRVDEGIVRLMEGAGSPGSGTA